MKGPHICDCLCSLCERLGTGAFGPQPDGSPGVVVIRRRRGRRRQSHCHAKRGSQLQPAAWAGLRTLALGAKLPGRDALPDGMRPCFSENAVGPRSLGAPRGGAL